MTDPFPLLTPLSAAPMEYLPPDDADGDGFVNQQEFTKLPDERKAEYIERRTAFSGDPWLDRSMNVHQAASLLDSLGFDSANNVFNHLGSPNVLTPAQRTELASELFSRSRVLAPAEFSKLPDDRKAEYIARHTSFKDDPWGGRSMSVRDAVSLLASLGPKGAVGAVQRLGDARLLTPEQRSEFARELLSQVSSSGYIQLLLLPFKSDANQRAGTAPWLLALPEAAQKELLSKVMIPRVAQALTAPPISNELKRDADEAVIDTVKAHRVTFFTDHHGMNDEAYLAKLAQRMADVGVKHLTLEIPKEGFESEVTKFLASGNLEDLGDQKDLNTIGVRSLMKVAKIFDEKRIKIELIDMPKAEIEKALGPLNYLGSQVAIAAQMEHRPIPPEAMPGYLAYMKVRDEYMAHEIAKHAKDGKVVSLLGELHAIKEAQPNPTARELVDRAGISAATIKLEWPFQEGAEDPRCELGDTVSVARSHYFCTQPIEASFAYPTSAVGDLAMPDLTHSRMESADRNRQGPFVPYRTGADILIFMSPADSPLQSGNYWEKDSKATGVAR